MIGVDNSEEMLEIAREAEYEADAWSAAEAWDEAAETDEPEEYAELGEPDEPDELPNGGILYLLEDMRELELYGSVCAVVSVCDSMNYILEEADLREVFSRVHEYLEEDGVFTIGLTDYAQSALGDIVFINLPEEGDSVTAGESFSDVESVKAVSDVFSPVTGTVTAVNEALLDDPAQVNEAPYEAWLIKVSQVSDTEELLDAEGYEAVVAAEEA